MNDKNKTLANLGRELFDTLWRTSKELGFDEDDRIGLEETIDAFINYNAVRFTEEEFGKKFSTSESILDLYIAYLETKLETGSSTIH